MANGKKPRKKTTPKKSNLDKAQGILKSIIEGLDIIRDIRNQQQEDVSPPNIKEATVTKIEENPYVTMAVSRDVTEKALTSRYRALAHIYHPDVGGNKEKFKEITDAYEKIRKEKGWS